MEQSMRGQNKLAIDKKTPIIIYGAGNLGKFAYHSLCETNGYNVVGFLDVRADDIQSLFGLPVWSIDDQIDYSLGNCLVVLCVSNVFEHERIVCQLMEKGFRYFIYHSTNQTAENENDSAYHIICGDPVIKENIDGKAAFFLARDGKYELKPVIGLNKMPQTILRDYAIISSDDAYTIALVPLEQLFEPKVGCSLCDAANSSNILASTARIDLFRYFNGENASVEGYLHHGALVASIYNDMTGTEEDGASYEKSLSWRESVLKGRRDVYHNMRAEMELDPAFFARHAVLATLDQRNRIFLPDGRHRAAFFAVKQRRFFPVKFSNQDYKKLLCLDAVRILSDWLNDEKKSTVEVPINHPYFYRFPSDLPDFYEKFVYRAVYIIAKQFEGKTQTSDLSVCDAFFHDGAIARTLRRMGFRTTTIVRSKTEARKIDLIDDLFYAGHSLYSNELITSDILFCTEDAYTDAFQKSDARLVFIESKKGTPPLIKAFEFQDRISRITSESAVLNYYLYTQTKPLK